MPFIVTLANGDAFRADEVRLEPNGALLVQRPDAEEGKIELRTWAPHAWVSFSEIRYEADSPFQEHR